MSRKEPQMAWMWWQQRRADHAESRLINRYLQQRDASRVLWDVVVEARREAESRLRLEAALQAQRISA
ncbi:MAG: hypothetical protein WAL84_09020 [Candidatus Dormiibacterota bacterium]